MNLSPFVYLHYKNLPKNIDKVPYSLPNSSGSTNDTGLQSDHIAQFEYYFQENKDPEKNLWLHMLYQAIWDYKEYIQKGKKELAEVFDWFFNCDNYEPGSFLYVCETLSINSNYFLKQLIYWSKENYETI